MSDHPEIIIVLVLAMVAAWSVTCWYIQQRRIEVSDPPPPTPAPAKRRYRRKHKPTFVARQRAIWKNHPANN